MTRSVASLPVHRLLLRCILAASLSVSWVAASVAQELSKLPYVPTPQIVVDEMLKFIEQDMFKTDISKATVVTLYVLPDFMEKLRPKMLAELKPGSRIVAHDYYMSDWYPDRQLSLTVPEKVKANGTD